MSKKLYRSLSDKKLAGVCGGIAEYFGLDATLIRVGWALVSLFLGAGVLAYIVCALIIPQKPENPNIVDAE